MKIAKRRRRHTAVALWMRLEDWAGGAVVVALLLGFGWWIATAGGETPAEYCAERYARARTRQDSVVVDYSRVASGARTCGELQRGGSRLSSG